jgi:hypothetical protein
MICVYHPRNQRKARFGAALRKLVACDFNHTGNPAGGLSVQRIPREGVTAMTGNRKAILWITAALVGVVVVASIALGYPTEVAHPVLGGEWQCHRSAIVTTCRRASHGERITDRAHVQLVTDTQRV